MPTLDICVTDRGREIAACPYWEKGIQNGGMIVEIEHGRVLKGTISFWLLRITIKYVLAGTSHHSQLGHMTDAGQFNGDVVTL